MNLSQVPTCAIDKLTSSIKMHVRRKATSEEKLGAKRTEQYNAVLKIVERARLGKPADRSLNVSKYNMDIGTGLSFISGFKPYNNNIMYPVTSAGISFPIFHSKIGGEARFHQFIDTIVAPLNPDLAKELTEGLAHRKTLKSIVPAIDYRPIQTGVSTGTTATTKQPYFQSPKQAVKQTESVPAAVLTPKASSPAFSPATRRRKNPQITSPVQSRAIMRSPKRGNTDKSPSGIRMPSPRKQFSRRRR